MKRYLLISFLQCRRGATAIEFALIGLILFYLIFGIIEFSLLMFSASAIESATNISSRLGKTNFVDSTALDENGQPLSREQYIRALLKNRVGGLVDANKIIIETRVYPNLATPGGQQGDPTGRLGNGGEIVEYTVRYRWPIYTPLLGRFFTSTNGAYEIVSRTIVRNEPFGTGR